ncbi:MAG: hypothetical protein ABIT20_05200 [Gemmatimonadaceae bacterium]
MIAPPLTVERLLAGLSARTSFRDGVLGDLAEEFSERAERDGPSVARHWYYREALRAAPHLALDWVRTLDVREVRRLVNAVFGAYFLTLLLGWFMMSVVDSTMEMLGYDAWPVAVMHGPAMLILSLADAAAIGLLTGYCGASLDKKTPIVSAVLLGFLVAVPNMAMAYAFNSGDPFYRPIAGILMIVGAIAGGVLNVRNARFENPDDLEWLNTHVIS